MPEDELPPLHVGDHVTDRWITTDTVAEVTR